MSIIIPQKKHHVYVLIDDIDGIFYVGSGNTARLHSTIAEAKPGPHPASKTRKAQKIREIWEEGREVKQKVMLSSDDEATVRKYENFLIRHYGLRLTNYQGIQSAYTQQSYYEYGQEDEQALNRFRPPREAPIPSPLRPGSSTPRAAAGRARPPRSLPRRSAARSRRRRPRA